LQQQHLLSLDERDFAVPPLQRKKVNVNV
jgi:hypothetical protein